MAAENTPPTRPTVQIMLKKNLKNILGDVVLIDEIDWMLRHALWNRPRKDHFNLDRLKKSLPAARAVVEPFALRAERSRSGGKNVLFFATLHYWIEQSAYLGLVLAGLGHKVTLLTLPYSEWHKQKDNFTQRQRILHTRGALSSLSPLIEHASLLDLRPSTALPDILLSDVIEISLWDVQYTRSEEHTSQLQSRPHPVFPLLPLK